MNQEKKPEPLWAIVAILGLIILLVIGYKLKISMAPNIIASATIDKACDLRKGACTSELPSGGKISFSMTPNTIPILRPLELNVITEGIEVSTIKVDLVGIDMDMGYNRPKLDRIDPHHFKGTMVIPVCVYSKMEWEARVLLNTNKGLIMAPFRFYTIK
ncbi:MAG: hypothetical protein KAH22_10205 [Thiotrichaceae bacterium]|nr:hypothetical protein [Thiotrichaceae bacterium]